MIEYTTDIFIRKSQAGVQMADKETNRPQNSARPNIRQPKEQIVFFSTFILFIVVSIFLDRKSALPFIEESIPANAEWITESNESVDLYEQHFGIMDLSRDVSDIDLQGKSLCMKSIDTVLDVYADGKLIYSYDPDIPKRLGISYGMYVHTIAIPENTEILGLHLEPVFPKTPVALNDVVIGDGSRYMTDLFRRNLGAFGLSSQIVLVGLMFLAIGIFARVLMNTVGLDFISFGVLCILIGFIGYNDTLLLQVLTRHPALVRVITYICLIFLPYPAVSFFAGATGYSHSKLVSATLFVCLVDFIAQVFLTYYGISDYYYMLPVSHVIIAVAFAIIAFLIARGIRQNTIQTELLRSLTLGILVLLIGVGIDFTRYYLKQSYGSSGYTRLGVLIFTFLVGIYLMRRQTEGLRQKQQENQTFIREITTAFARVIDMKDSYTNGHSSRVAKYTSMLARELGYDEETVERYYRIALLHDVGKIGIPKAVLNKPGKLTDEEYEIIKSHTSKGYEVLKDISIMPDLATGARSHHERPDGQGYPNGLHGENIPRAAQIIAVADCFDAMYSNRPYRKRMNFDKAVSIIREVSGTQLTPDVVDAFLRLVDKGEFRAADDTGGGSTENIDNIRKQEHSNKERDN